MFYILEKCISSVYTNISQILDSLNSTSCVKLHKKAELTSPEVIPLNVNRACVNGSNVSIIQEVLWRQTCHKIHLMEHEVK